MYLYLCVWINLYDNNWLQIRWETQLKKNNPNIYYGPYTSLLLRIIFYKRKTVLGISWLQWLDSRLSGKAFKSLFDVLNWKKQSISGTSELFWSIKSCKRESYSTEKVRFQIQFYPPRHLNLGLSLNCKIADLDQWCKSLNVVGAELVFVE